MSATAIRPLLAVSGVTKYFAGKPALRGIDLSLDAGEVVCVIGPSGCGKSTLLRCINHLEEPDDGFVFLDGEPVGRSPRRGPPPSSEALDRMRARIGMVFQQFNVWPHLSVLGNITKGPIVVGRRDPAQVEAEARALLARVDLLDKADAWPGELSGGQLQRVAIARALAMQPALMLFDEPTSALDAELIGEVLKVMRDLARDGMTMLIVTHELRFARQVADRVVFMDEGLIVEQGVPEECLARPRSERLRQFLSQVLADRETV
jgi:polar amino acid transport system ATP-binding protein